MENFKFIAGQASSINQYKTTRSKLLKCCANVYFNKQCLAINDWCVILIWIYEWFKPYPIHEFVRMVTVFIADLSGISSLGNNVSEG